MSCHILFLGIFCNKTEYCRLLNWDFSDLNVICAYFILWFILKMRVCSFLKFALFCVSVKFQYCGKNGLTNFSANFFVWVYFQVFYHGFYSFFYLFFYKLIVLRVVLEEKPVFSLSPRPFLIRSITILK